MFLDFLTFLSTKKNYAYSFILFILAIFVSCSLLTYNYYDPSFNRASNITAHNWMGIYGAYLADPMLQLFGISNVVLPICATCWSILQLRDKQISLFWLRVIAMIILLFVLSSALSQIKTPESWPFKTYGGYLGITIYNQVKLLIPHQILPYLTLVSIILLSYLTLAVSLNRWLFFIKKIGYCFNKLFYNLTIIGKKQIQSNELTQDKISSGVKQISQSSKKVKLQPSKLNNSINAQHNFILPSLEFLVKTSANKQHVDAAAIKKSTVELSIVLKDFGVRGKIIDVHTGPVVTLYELEPAAGTKSSRVIGLADDISRSMRAHASRIAVIPGRNALGIEIPNKRREIIYLRELLESKNYKFSGYNLPLILGKNITGLPIIADLAKMPHLLVAGTTGSGKSVAINAMILSLLYSLSPEQCKLILIDPKMLELSVYESIPHLLTPVVTEPQKAVTALKWVVKEMEERYRMMSNLGVRNISGYNEKIIHAIAQNTPLYRNIQTGYDSETGVPIIEKLPIEKKKLPFIVVVVDEMADLMLVAGKDIETSIQRLSQMARAAGIHIIMATQRPSVDVITGVIKANFPTRISFSVTSKIDSRTILGEQGAEQLLGMGDMLYMGNGSKINRVHGPFVSDEEVRNVVNHLKKQAKPQYMEEITIDAEESSNKNTLNIHETNEDDELYQKAVEIVMREQKASTSFIQRCLRIGYNRAASIIEKMEKNGIVSSANHVGKREILKQK